MNKQGAVIPAGTLEFQVTRGEGSRFAERMPDHSLWPSADNSRAIVEHGMPHAGLDAGVSAWRAANFRHLQRGWRKVALAKALQIPTYYGALFCTVFRGDGRVERLGLASLRVVTTAGVGFIVDAFQNTTELENMKFHGYGTGSTAEAIGDTALVVELTTEYNPNSTRPTGTTVEGASANIYRTVATLTPDSGTPILREHGIFSQAATGGGVLLDRSVFAAITLDSVAGDSLQTTYELTFPAGG